MSRPRSTSSSSTHLGIPRKSTELQDPGAHELSSDDEFQDATEDGKRGSRPVTPSSPIPITRVEKVDDQPSHGEVVGSAAYQIRRQDAVPDEVEIIPDGQLSKRSSKQNLEGSLTSGGTPRTVGLAETNSPSGPSKSPSFDQTAHPGNMPIPETVVTRVDDDLAHGEIPGTKAAEIRKQDAKPDKTEVVPEESDDTDDETNNEHDGLGDDFDDFEEGDQTAADDDFGDFDDFDAAEDEALSPPTPPPATMTFPLIDFDALSSLPDLLETTRMHLDAMFPTTAVDSEMTTASDDIPGDSPIFPSERSRSLWKQLITPPPLQPPNWTQSRIRRLFLISLGVPVDLDEILPPSKQKKLILPDIDLPSRHSMAADEDRPTNDNISKLKDSKANDSTTSVGSTQSAPIGVAKRGRERPKSMKPGPPPPPVLDLNAVQRICSTTNEKLAGFTDEELQNHVKDLEDLTEKTSQLLEYWLKRRDGLRKEKEAFEGVIENLVRHAKRVRTIR